MTRVVLPALLLLGLLATTAVAHGGGYRDAPGPPPPGCSEPWGGPPPPPPTHYGRGPVVGRILGADGAPLADARIWCESWQTARTGDDGRFRCAPERYPARLVVTAADHAPRVVTASAAPAPGAHLDLRDLALDVGGTIAGRVEAAEGDWGERLRVRIVPECARVPEAFALAAGVNGWSGVRVRAGGSFRFRGLPPGEYRVVVSRSDGPEAVVGRRLRPECEPLTICRADVPPAPDSPKAKKDAVLVLTHTAGRDVFVVERDTGRLLMARTDEERLRVPVPSGALIDVVLADGFGLLPPLEGLVAGQEVALPAAPARVSIAGRVIRVDGTPVVRATVEVSSAVDPRGALRREAETDAAGCFRVDGVVGRLRVRAASPGLTNDEHPCLTMAGDASVLVVVDEEPLPTGTPLDGDR